MQANNTPRFLKNFMIGLVASSAGAFIALPSSAMPEATETGAEIEAIEATEEIAAPTAAEALPTPGAEALEAAPTAEVAPVEEEMVAEEETTEEAVEAVASDEMTAEEPVAEGDALETDADTVEAAEIDALSDEAVEAADTMDGEPVVETVDAVDEPVADEETIEEMPVAEDDMETIDEPVADEETTEAEPVAAEEIKTTDFTIAELTDSSASFEILTAALAAADLTEILGSEGPFTVFAPTDEAFAALPEGAIDQLLRPENKNRLVQILTYHVVPGAILSTDLEEGDVATVEGSAIEIAIADTVTVNNANVVATDIEASNGVIHVVDRVIMLPESEAGSEAVDTDETAAVVAE